MQQKCEKFYFSSEELIEFLEAEFSFFDSLIYIWYFILFYFFFENFFY